eukprot:1160468-Pelagomonas_calceolata.AAC.13
MHLEPAIQPMSGIEAHRSSGGHMGSRCLTHRRTSSQSASQYRALRHTGAVGDTWVAGASPIDAPQAKLPGMGTQAVGASSFWPWPSPAAPHQGCM